MTNSSDVKKFPVMTTPRRAGAFVFWEMVEPHREQAHRNHGQSLERLAERGGCCPEELCAILEDREYCSMDYAEAESRLGELVTEFILTPTFKSPSQLSENELDMIRQINGFMYHGKDIEEEPKRI